jgi:hypothetical protein
VFGNLCIPNSVEVVIRRGAPSERALAHDENEIAFPKHFVNSFVLHCQPLLGQGLQPRDQASKPVGDLRVVLDVIVTVKVARKLVPAAIQKVIHIGLHQGFIELGLVEVGPMVGPSVMVWPLGLRSVAVCWRLSQCSTVFPSSNRKISKPTLGPPMLYSVWAKTKLPSGKHERY